MAGVLFKQIFCCCLGRRTDDQSILDDQSRLIPTPTEPTLDEIPSDAVVVKCRKIKQKLGSIVRAKEGKMVNVISPYPFNLHNKPPTALDSSSSRSVSITHGDRPPTDYRLPGRPIAPESTEDLFAPSSTAHRSRSISPFSPRWRQDDPEHYVPPSKPILNIRLVHGCTVGGSIRKRGRSKMKAGEDPNHTVAVRGDHNNMNLASRDKGKGKLELHIDTGEAESTEMTYDLFFMTSGLPSGGGEDTGQSVTMVIGQDNEAHAPQRANPCPQLSISPASDIDFRIHDMGAITVSWGD